MTRKTHSMVMYAAIMLTASSYATENTPGKKSPRLEGFNQKTWVVTDTTPPEEVRLHHSARASAPMVEGLWPRGDWKYRRLLQGKGKILLAVHFGFMEPFLEGDSIPTWLEVLWGVQQESFQQQIFIRSINPPVESGKVLVTGRESFDHGGGSLEMEAEWETSIGTVSAWRST